MTISEILGLISTIVAIQALFAHNYNKRVDEVIEKQKTEMEQISKNRNLASLNHEVFIGALSELSSVQRLYGSLIVRITEHLSLPNKDSISIEIGKYDYFLEKSIHEVNIFSSDKMQKQSSSRALAEEYGNLESLKLLKKCNNEIYNGEDPDLSSSIKKLELKINDKLSNV
jgi:hypothetical protein